MPLTPVVFHVLLSLADGPLHGYAIMQSVAETSGAEPPMGPGTIYGSLERMTRDGLIRTQAPGGRGKGRRRFGLTPKGHRALWAESARLDRLARLARARGLLSVEGGL